MSGAVILMQKACQNLNDTSERFMVILSIRRLPESRSKLLSCQDDGRVVPTEWYPRADSTTHFIPGQTLKFFPSLGILMPHFSGTGSKKLGDKILNHTEYRLIISTRSTTSHLCAKWHKPAKENGRILPCGPAANRISFIQTKKGTFLTRKEVNTCERREDPAQRRGT